MDTKSPQAGPGGLYGLGRSAVPRGRVRWVSGGKPSVRHPAALVTAGLALAVGAGLFFITAVTEIGAILLTITELTMLNVVLTR
jgi:hypothetical protein